MSWFEVYLKNVRNHISLTLRGKTEEIKIQGVYEKPYFEGKTVCKILQISDYKNILNNHVPKKYKHTLRKLQEQVRVDLPQPSGSGDIILGKTYHKLSHKKGSAIYVDLRGLKCIFSISAFTDPEIAREFSKELKQKLNIDLDFECFETRDDLESVKRALPGLDFIERYPISKNVLDLYSEKYKIAVVQKNFKKMDTFVQIDLKRAESELGCDIVVFDSSSDNFNIFKVIGEISQIAFGKIV